MILRHALLGATCCAVLEAAAQGGGAAPAPVPAPPAAPADAAPVPQRIEIRGEVDSDTERRRREPVATSVVGRDELDRYNDPSVADVLRRQPGVNLQGGNPRLRGLGAGYTLILVNGEPAPPGFSLENLPPSQVERIEITKGPTAQHSAQAVAGTINIILREPPRQRQRELGVRLGYTQYRVVPAFNALWADRFGAVSVSLPVSGYRWHGGAVHDSARLTRDPRGALLRASVDGLDRWWGGGASFGPRVGVRLDANTTLEGSAFVQRHDFNSAGRNLSVVDETVGNGSRFVPSVDDRWRHAGFWEMARTGASLTRRFDDGARLEARVGAQSSRSRWATHVDGLDAAGVQTLTRDVGFAAREQVGTTSGKFTQPWREAHTLAAGWDLEAKRRTETRTSVENGRPQLEGFEARPFDAEVSRLAAFVQDEWQIAPRWSAYLGLRGESITTTSVDQGVELRSRSSVVTPVLHLNHRFKADGRDLLRASLTRSYKAPDLAALMARPTINSAYPVSAANPEISPDRTGNPALQPELATGLDIALERYLPRGGVVSAGLFHRRIRGLIRHAVTLETVPWAGVPRWVSRPVNLAGATSTGVELELKGRVDELWRAAPLPPAMTVRASLSAYRSTVQDIPGPDNRLEQQQPWSLNLGFDHRTAGQALGFGANLGFTPGYATQQTAAQRRSVGRARSLDAYVVLSFSRDAHLRLSGSNLLRSTSRTLLQTQETGGVLLSDDQLRVQHASWNLGLQLKF